jgi:hypothetical protein
MKFFLLTFLLLTAGQSARAAEFYCYQANQELNLRLNINSRHELQLSNGAAPVAGRDECAGQSDYFLFRKSSGGSSTTYELFSNDPHDRNIEGNVYTRDASGICHHAALSCDNADVPADSGPGCSSINLGCTTDPLPNGPS